MAAAATVGDQRLQRLRAKRDRPHPVARAAADKPVGSVPTAHVSHSLHLRVAGNDIHLRMPNSTDPTELLAICAEAMRGHRVVDFPDTLAPGAVHRSTVVINFEHVSGAWIDSDDA